jgi:hypothetical protein
MYIVTAFALNYSTQNLGLPRELFQKSVRVPNQGFHHRQPLFDGRLLTLLLFELCRASSPPTSSF